MSLPIQPLPQDPEMGPPSRASTASIPPPPHPSNMMAVQPGGQQPIFPSQQRMYQQHTTQLAYNNQLMNQLIEMDQQQHSQQQQQRQSQQQHHIHQQQQQQQQQQHQAAQRQIQQQQLQQSQPQQQLIPPTQMPREAQVHQQHLQMVPHPQVPYPSQEGLMVAQGFHPQHPQLQQAGTPDQLQLHGIPFSHHIHAPLAVQSFAGIPDLSLDPKKKGNNFRAMNEKELRQLLNSNETRELNDVAKEVKAAEHTPRAEKTKQLFAMLWLQGACVSAKRSTPRSRVYAAYAARCGTEHVPPLNPASFGKLVRVIFPGIKTRRLGVRGESKYHYVDLALVKELEHFGGDGPGMFSSRASVDTVGDMSTASVSFAAGDQSELIGQAGLGLGDEMDNSDIPSSVPSQGRLFAHVLDHNAVPNPKELAATYSISLQFAPDRNSSLFQNSDDVIALPNIHDYAPPKTDIDAAEALTALYRTHCTSLIDCVRYCKEKQFFRLFTSFQGTLTVPVQKLLTHPSLAAWVRECDWRMYQKMIRFVSGLALQVAPQLVIRFLQTVSDTIHHHIAKTFSAYPPHLVDAKVEPATIFAALLRRMLKVNRCAHEAAALLASDETRLQMWIDWVRIVNPIRVIESELPVADYGVVYKLLTHDVRELLMPTNVPEDLEVGTFFEEAAAMAAAASAAGRGSSASQNNFKNPSGEDTNDGASTSTGPDGGETSVDRIAAFLTRLPSLFPNAKTRTILQTTTCLLDAALRDFTLASVPSFGSWWLIKMFVDEMGRWLAEVGGFLSRSSVAVAVTAAAAASVDEPVVEGIPEGLEAEDELVVAQGLGSPEMESVGIVNAPPAMAKPDVRKPATGIVAAPLSPLEPSVSPEPRVIHPGNLIPTAPVMQQSQGLVGTAHKRALSVEEEGENQPPRQQQPDQFQQSQFQQHHQHTYSFDLSSAPAIVAAQVPIRPASAFDHRSMSMPVSAMGHQMSQSTILAQSGSSGSVTGPVSLQAPSSTAQPTAAQPGQMPPTGPSGRPISRLPPTGSFVVSKRRKPLGRSVSSVSALSANRVFSAFEESKKVAGNLTPPVTPNMVVSGLSSTAVGAGVVESSLSSTLGTDGTGVVVANLQQGQVPVQGPIEDEKAAGTDEELDDSGICLEPFPGTKGYDLTASFGGDMAAQFRHQQQQQQQQQQAGHHHHQHVKSVSAVVPMQSTIGVGVPVHMQQQLEQSQQQQQQGIQMSLLQQQQQHHHQLMNVNVTVPGGGAGMGIGMDKGNVMYQS